ncbi:alpha/beta hydrolase [Calothrix sp. 336/3]|nr:alpha/beta hydrolase [Calothrix sp. 336/3]
MHFHYIWHHRVNRPVILFLHGFMGNCHEFDEVITLLGENFSYLILDLPGHGKTQILGDGDNYRMAATADVIMQLLDNLRISQCFLVGYSMGGRLGLYLALHFPHRFYQVVLESASPGLKTESARQERIRTDAQIARKILRCGEKEDFLRFLDNWYSQEVFGDIKHHPQFSQMLQSRLTNQPQELAKSLNFMGTGSQPSLWEKLETNRIPILLLVGEKDSKFVEINREITPYSHLFQLHIISDAAHNIHLEKADTFAEYMNNYFHLIAATDKV